VGCRALDVGQAERLPAGDPTPGGVPAVLHGAALDAGSAIAVPALQPSTPILRNRDQLDAALADPALLQPTLSTHAAAGELPPLAIELPESEVLVHAGASSEIGFQGRERAAASYAVGVALQP
jgi:hypothetical protein